MLEFKLNYFFEKYKESSLISITDFKREFTKAEGNFDLLIELIKMIHDYQIKKYGECLVSGNMIVNKKRKKNYFNNIENARKRYRFGTVEERNTRKLKEAHKC